MSKYHKIDYKKSFYSINNEPIEDKELYIEYDGDNHNIKARNKDNMMEASISNDFLRRINDFTERNKMLPFNEKLVRINDPLEHKRGKNPSMFYRIPTPYPNTRKRKANKKKRTRNRKRNRREGSKKASNRKLKQSKQK